MNEVGLENMRKQQREGEIKETTIEVLLIGLKMRVVKESVTYRHYLDNR